MPGESIRLVHASGECEIDLARRELRVQGSPAPLGGRAFEVIEALVRSAGELVTKNQLINRVWPGAIVTDNTLHVHTMAVRKALGPYRTLLKTESGRGYRLLGDWTVRRHDAAAPSVGVRRMRMNGESPVTNFPAAVSRLVGRTAAVARVRDLVSAYRVVTLTGPGGIGKTSLALKAARGIVGDFADGGWLVELASLSDPTLVPATVAGVLRLTLGGGAISAEAVARAIGDNNLPLLLDNCEHLIETVAGLTDTFVRRCPRVTMLTTSRETLRVDGEYVYRVAALDVPAIDDNAADQILSCSAVELFVTRANAHGHDFMPRAENLSQIAAICRRLDGMPLAIEFAAARAATLGIQQVAAGLADRLALLTSGRRTALPRHRTLRTVLDWSHGLLPEAEQLLLRRLAIFPAGFTLDAVVAVMADTEPNTAWVTDRLANLVTKSLVMADRSGTGARWHLLESTRVYALEKLVKGGEEKTTARLHAGYFRDLLAPISGVTPRLSTADLARHVREIDNVRAALDWAFSDIGDPANGIDIAASYAPIWLYLSLNGECRDRCEQALHHLERQPPTAANAGLRMRLNIPLITALTATLGPAERAETTLVETIEIADTLDDCAALARGLSDLGNMYVFHGEYGNARITVEGLGQVARRLDDPTIVHHADRLMGNALLGLGRPREAQEYLERVLRSSAVPDDRRRTVWYQHTNEPLLARAVLAWALCMRGLTDQARHEAQRSLEELHEADHEIVVCRALYYGIWRIALMIDDFATAERAIGRLVEAAARGNAPFWMNMGRFATGKLLVQRGEFAQGLSVLREASETCNRTGWRMSYPEFKGALALALAGLGQPDDALDAAMDGVVSAGEGENGQRWYVPELLRIKGQVLLLRTGDGSVSAAEACFDQAGELAREQGALFWELRVALSLARLRAAQNRHGEARQALAPVYDRFTEGFGTLDLQAARTFLDELPD